MDSAKSGELQKMIEILEKSLFTMNSAKSGKPQKMIEIFEKKQRSFSAYLALSTSMDSAKSQKLLHLLQRMIFFEKKHFQDHAS